MNYSKTTEEYARISHKINNSTDMSNILQRVSEVNEEKVFHPP
jgi:hypothetical protein